ncbi:TPA: DNA lyase [candidate division WOR-3 bacterium]|jgi:N-glycosylase/DNA lyase|uniref:8-oxoguanine DNA glycosylase/AP lyase n=1 Tax=candidate division WOR-3 bacterium TaxID=2052148 RepID=A0A350H9B4_UNCW3|nr:DNA lyase [candidate division WOR-3 bacterium]
MKNKNINEIKDIYAKIKPEIVQRIKVFEQTGRNMSRDELFYELGFCLFTPQSKATMCWDSVCSIKKNMKNNHKSKEILPHLIGVRFKYKKSEYFEEAQKKWFDSGKYTIYSKISSENNEKEMREFLVKNIRGLGYKEASHFLRNIGHGKNFAILDRHILKNLKILGIIDVVPKSLARNHYLDIEDKMALFSNRIEIPLSHLDFVLWYKEAGIVFK